MYPDYPLSYGFGLIVARGITLGSHFYDVPIWQHGGNTFDFTSTFVVLPEQRFAISILSNGQNDVFPTSVATAIQTLVDLPAPATAPSLPFDPSALDSFTGTYVDTVDGTTAIIARDGDSLTVSVPDFDTQGIPYDHAMQHATTRVWSVKIAGDVFDFSFIDTPAGTYLRGRDAVLLKQ
jgi:hypothetical protein